MKLLPVLTPLLLTVIAVLLALILWRLPPSSPTVQEWEDAKSGQAVEELKSRMPAHYIVEFGDAVDINDPVEVKIVR